MSRPHFPDVEKIRFADAKTNGESASPDDLSFRSYDPERLVLGKRMEDQLRVSVCFWHSFGFDGSDMFGDTTFARSWQTSASASEPMKQAALRLEAAFEFFEKLGAPFFCFHDADVAPAGDSLAASNDQLDRMAELIEGHMERTGVRLLWGTANLFSHPRYAAGAATNPDPEVFAYAAGQVKHALEVTARLAGTNYVLWGGREGYDTLLNTDMRRESAQLGRFMQLVVEHKHKIGFEGTLLIEPKPHEPCKHQYDHDAAAVHAFLLRHGLEDEIKLNIEVNHATLAGHSFQHEIAYAAANDLLGSVDANRGDPQNGWDTDQFPNSPEELTTALFEILRAGGLGKGGFNFDAKLRRQSLDPIDLFHAHIGGMDALARGLLGAERLLASGQLQHFVDERYAGWDKELGRQILSGERDLAQLASHIVSNGIDPKPRSGRQEMLENLVSRSID